MSEYTFTVTVEVLYQLDGGEEDVDSTTPVFRTFTDEDEAYRWRDELIDRSEDMEENPGWRDDE